MNEITPALIYWITRLDAINETAEALTVCFGTSLAFALAFGIFAKCNSDDDIGNVCFKVVRWTSPIVLVASLLLIFVPTKKEMAAILVIPRIANSETVSEIGDCAKTLAVEWLEELRPQKKGDK